MWFTRKEFLCKCGYCNQDTVDYELLEVLMRLRDFFGVPITILSGNRCRIHNKKSGGSINSQHLYSKASDISVKGIEPRIVYDTLDRWYPDKYGLGLYTNRTHLDIRYKKARWEVT